VIPFLLSLHLRAILNGLYGSMHSALTLPVCLALFPCRDRVHDWVRQASHLDAPEEDGSPDDPPSPRHKGRQHRTGHNHAIPEADAEVAVHVNIPGQRLKVGQLPPSKDKHTAMASEDESDDLPNRPSMIAYRSAEVGSEAGSSFAGSMADGMGESGGSGIDPAESALVAGHEDDLAVDTRCGGPG